MKPIVHGADGANIISLTRKKCSIRDQEHSLRQSVFLITSYTGELKNCLDLSLNLDVENKIINHSVVCILTGNPPQYGVSEALIVPQLAKIKDAIISPPATSSCRVPITTAAIPCPLVIPILQPGCRSFSRSNIVTRANQSSTLGANIPDLITWVLRRTSKTCLEYVNGMHRQRHQIDR